MNVKRISQEPRPPGPVEHSSFGNDRVDSLAEEAMPSSVNPGPSLDGIADLHAIDRQAEVFSALGEPIRIQMITLIAGVDELPCTVLVENIPLSKSTISYHVKILHRAGLIDVRKDGRNFHYTLRRRVLEEFVPEFLLFLSRRYNATNALHPEGGLEGGDRLSPSLRQLA
jgi:ArsR family transcriptional regulator